MSEFSESYQLRGEDQQAGVATLGRGRLSGWVLAPGGGWTTLIPAVEFRGEYLHQLMAASGPQPILYYMHAEDHGWSFAWAVGGAVEFTYSCDWDDDIDVRTSAADEADFARRIAVLGISGDLSWLLDEATIDRMLMSGDHPAPMFARAVGLTNFEWLSGSYVLADEGPDDPDAIAVGV